jgi:hypothetical protein
MATTIPLPLALNFAAWTALGLFTGFAGLLNLLDPSSNLIRGHVLLGIAAFAFGYVAGTVLGRREAPVVGMVGQLAAIGVGAGYYLRADNPFGWVLIVLGVWGLLTLLRYRKTALA